MGATRTRSAVFLIQYLAVLLLALAWVQLGYVRERVGSNLHLLYLLVASCAVYLAVRAYLVVMRGISGYWRYAWLSADLTIITLGVRLTGGIRSEAALLYFWPLVISSIRRLPYRTLAVGVASGVLYSLASWPAHVTSYFVETLSVRLLVLLMATGLALYYALSEAALIEELGSLRERVALADYRTRLSREMHDGIQHYLADIAVRLELARRLMATDPAEAARIAVDQRFAIRQAAAELRYLVRLLRSPAVEHEGFVDAVRHHLSVLAESSSASAPLEIVGEARPLPPEVAHAAFRVMQEAVMNAEKHAQATEVRVTLAFGPDCFGCTIRDNGVGFDLASLPEAPLGSGFGLPGMAQRAESIGGKVEVSSAPGQGTLVAFTAPVGEIGAA